MNYRMKKRSKSFFLFLLILLVINSFAYSVVLRGALAKFGTHGILPASFVNITLATESGQNLKTELTDSEGMYYFYDVEPGLYILKIWVKGFDGKPINYEVEVLNRPITQAKTFLIHYFKFESPEEEIITLGRPVHIGARGIHYNLPTDARIWIVLKCRNDNFLIKTKRHIYIKKEGKWASDEILIDRQIKEILAVLVTKAGNYFFLHESSNELWSEFPHLPENSYILASRKLIF